MFERLCLNDFALLIKSFSDAFTFRKRLVQFPEKFWQAFPGFIVRDHHAAASFWGDFVLGCFVTHDKKDISAWDPSAQPREICVAVGCLELYGLRELEGIIASVEKFGVSTSTVPPYLREQAHMFAADKLAGLRERCLPDTVKVFFEDPTQIGPQTCMKHNELLYGIHISVSSTFSFFFLIHTILQRSLVTCTMTCCCCNITGNAQAGPLNCLPAVKRCT